jgi:hypothetical protein
MKQVVSNYSYSPATNVLTLSGVNIDQDQLLLVVAPGVGRTMYNFASGVTGVVSAGINTRVTLNASTASLTTTSPLVIYYDDQLTNNSVTISSLPAISGTVTANTYNSIEFFYMPTFRTSRSPSVDHGGYFQRVNQNTWQCGKNTESGLGIQTFYWSEVYTWIYRIDDGDGGADIFYFEDSNDLFPIVNQIICFNGYSITSGNPTIFYIRPDTQPISGTVTVGNSVTVSSLPVQLSTTTIGGTARLNVTLSSATTIGATAPSYGNLYGGSDGTNLRAISVDTSGRTVVTGSVSVANTVPISGTVTANISGTVPVSISSVTIGNTVTVAGTVTANVASTTVTISAQPSGALTTRFGSVVTANTAGITTAVTNTSRKYLLAQNISTGTVTIGIGFSPSTTQGIQLTAGAGLTFDSFVPTGAVYWLGATTGAAYTILEG